MLAASGGSQSAGEEVAAAHAAVQAERQSAAEVPLSATSSQAAAAPWTPSQPHVAVDPVLCAAHIIVALQSVVSRNVPSKEQCILSITMVHGGEVFNVIPEWVPGPFPLGFSFSSKAYIDNAVASNGGTAAYVPYLFESDELMGPAPDFGKGF